MISPVDLFNSLEAFRSRLASAYCGDLDIDRDRYDGDFPFPVPPGSVLALLPDRARATGGKAKYLIGAILDPVLAVFKFKFHEFFASTINNSSKLIYSFFCNKKFVKLHNWGNI